MKRYLVVGLGVLLAVFIFGLDRGIYVASDAVVMGAPCCADLNYIQKRCLYLFVTGISTINATDGKIPIGPLLGRDRAILKQGGFSDAEIAEWAATLDAQQMLRRHPEADNSYCRILGD